MRLLVCGTTSTATKVIDSEQSRIYDQAEYRRHVRKAILSKILN